MRVDSAYYDSNVFLNSENPSHVECESCRAVLDVSRISWIVCFSPDLTTAESTVSPEYLGQFEIWCAANGVVVRSVSARDRADASKRHMLLKRQLALAGLPPRDWKHLMGAAASNANAVLSTDADFWDPANKGRKRAKVLLDSMKRAIEQALPLWILLPTEFLTLAAVNTARPSFASDKTLPTHARGLADV